MDRPAPHDGQASATGAAGLARDWSTSPAITQAGPCEDLRSAAGMRASGRVAWQEVQKSRPGEGFGGSAISALQLGQAGPSATSAVHRQVMSPTVSVSLAWGV